MDFEKANELLEEKETFPMTISEAEIVLKKRINLTPMIEQAESFEIVDDDTAKQALSMSLQSRKIKNTLNKTRLSIVRPHVDFQRAVNQLCKELEEKLLSIEEVLRIKMENWFQTQSKCNLSDLMNQKIEVDDGSLKQVSKWEFSIEDEKLIPREFLTPDVVAIEKAIKAGIRDIPGIKIVEKKEIAMRVKN